MVSVLTSNAVDCGFKPRSSQTKDKIIGICGFPLTTQQYTLRGTTYGSESE